MRSEAGIWPQQNVPEVVWILATDRGMNMIRCMEITVTLPDHLMDRVEAIASARGTTVSVVVTEAVSRLLEPDLHSGRYRLPVFDLGAPAVDIVDRDALYDFLDRDSSP